MGCSRQAPTISKPAHPPRWPSTWRRSAPTTRAARHWACTAWLPYAPATHAPIAPPNSSRLSRREHEHREDNHLWIEPDLGLLERRRDVLPGYLQSLAPAGTPDHIRGARYLLAPGPSRPCGG